MGGGGEDGECEAIVRKVCDVNERLDRGEERESILQLKS